MGEIKIQKLNPYYYPQGDELGRHWVLMYKALSQKCVGYGETPEKAKEDLNKRINNGNMHRSRALP